ncbi:hypothetical protein DM01DRAFT_1399361 [Hesseltinella vesiculosa]|uniref:Uncharacterized protein n=1 Tax=Hesseltinella vesiculosa TaxID=101127 RepID=A0A1X2G3L5_9FUNG|nr:hypothetical protein DM01DRAFT_1399361 [Hesseltinella vesiculosa]
MSASLAIRQVSSMWVPILPHQKDMTNVQTTLDRNSLCACQTNAPKPTPLPWMPLSLPTCFGTWPCNCPPDPDHRRLVGYFLVVGATRCCLVPCLPPWLIHFLALCDPAKCPFLPGPPFSFCWSPIHSRRQGHHFFRCQHERPPCGLPHRAPPLPIVPSDTKPTSTGSLSWTTSGKWTSFLGPPTRDPPLGSSVFFFL